MPQLAHAAALGTQEECERVIEVGGKHFERSVAGDGVQAVRTSSTAWCSPGACQSDLTMQAIRERIANLTLVTAARWNAYSSHDRRPSPPPASWCWRGGSWLARHSLELCP